MTTRRELLVDRPVLPAGYIMEGVEQRFLEWDYVEQRLTESITYWIGTTRPNGRPHISPIWGIWHEGCFWFDGSPETRRGKNIAHNPYITVNLEDGTKVVIVEGVVTDLKEVSLGVRQTLSEVYTAKYSAHGYSPEPETWESGIYVTEPHTILAWTEFGVDMTRWKVRQVE